MGSAQLRGRGPQGAASLHFNRRERPPDEPHMANSSAVRSPRPWPRNAMTPRCRLRRASRPSRARCPPALTPERFPPLQPHLAKAFCLNGLPSAPANSRELPSAQRRLASPAPSQGSWGGRQREAPSQAAASARLEEQGSSLPSSPSSPLRSSKGTALLSGGAVGRVPWATPDPQSGLPGAQRQLCPLLTHSSPLPTHEVFQRGTRGAWSSRLCAWWELKLKDLGGPRAAAAPSIERGASRGEHRAGSIVRGASRGRGSESRAFSIPRSSGTAAESPTLPSPGTQPP